MTKIFELLALMLPTKSVSSIVGSLEAFVTKLEAAEARQTEKAAKFFEQSRSLAAKAAQANTEASRASRVASNIRNITV